MSTFAQSLLDHIPTGEENAVSGRDLAAMLHCRYRDITRSINTLRQHGAVICSCARGYYIPADETDVLHFVRTMKSRQREIRLATVSAEERLRLWAIQREFNGETLFKDVGDDLNE